MRRRARSCLLALAVAVAALFCSAQSAQATLNNVENALTVLGQDDGTFAGNVVHTKSGLNDSPNALGFSAPIASALDATNNRLFVADSSNNRVLVFSLTSGNALNSMIAANVLGQADFRSNTASTTRDGLECRPRQHRQWRKRVLCARPDCARPDEFHRRRIQSVQLHHAHTIRNVQPQRRGIRFRQHPRVRGRPKQRARPGFQCRHWHHRQRRERLKCTGAGRLHHRHGRAYAGGHVASRVSCLRLRQHPPVRG